MWKPRGFRAEWGLGHWLCESTAPRWEEGCRQQGELGQDTDMLQGGMLVMAETSDRWANSHTWCTGVGLHSNWLLHILNINPDLKDSPP